MGSKSLMVTDASTIEVEIQSNNHIIHQFLVFRAYHSNELFDYRRMRKLIIITEKKCQT